MSADAERDRVVAWLREQSNVHHRIARAQMENDELRQQHVSLSYAYGCAADALSRNAHRAP